MYMHIKKVCIGRCMIYDMHDTLTCMYHMCTAAVSYILSNIGYTVLIRYSICMNTTCMYHTVLCTRDLGTFDGDFQVRI